MPTPTTDPAPPPLTGYAVTLIVQVYVPHAATPAEARDRARTVVQGHVAAQVTDVTVDDCQAD